VFLISAVRFSSNDYSHISASVQIRMPFRLLQATGEFWRLRRGASVTLDESQSKCSRKDALMRRLLLLVAGSTLASRLRASSKCATSSPPELKGAPVPTPTPFVPTTAAATAVDLPLGGLDLPTNTRYMSALASFFIFFRLDLASLLWKIYLWVSLIWLGAFSSL
jgi:hypothetical protein